MAIEVFISHSHKDSKIAEALVSLLVSGVGIERREIRCTSGFDTGLSSGAAISDDLRKDIKRCSYFVPLITENSVTSEFVGFEIGAAWALGKACIPVVYMPGTQVAMPSLLNGLLYRNLLDQSALVAMVHDLASAIFVKADQLSPSEVLAAANTFLSMIGAQQFATGRRP